MHAKRTQKVQSQSFDLLSTNPQELEDASNVGPEQPIPRGHARRGTNTATTPLPLELRSTRSRALDADRAIDQVGPRSSFTEFMASARKVNTKSPPPSALHQEIAIATTLAPYIASALTPAEETQRLEESLAELRRQLREQQQAQQIREEALTVIIDGLQRDKEVIEISPTPSVQPQTSHSAITADVIEISSSAEHEEMRSITANLPSSVERQYGQIEDQSLCALLLAGARDYQDRFQSSQELPATKFTAKCRRCGRNHEYSDNLCTEIFTTEGLDCTPLNSREHSDRIMKKMLYQQPRPLTPTVSTIAATESPIPDGLLDLFKARMRQVAAKEEQPVNPEYARMMADVNYARDIERRRQGLPSAALATSRHDLLAPTMTLRDKKPPSILKVEKTPVKVTIAEVLAKEASIISAAQARIAAIQANPAKPATGKTNRCTHRRTNWSIQDYRVRASQRR